MKTCKSCGGVLGRDCFNPYECAQITDDMERRAREEQQNNLAQVMSKLAEKIPTLYPYEDWAGAVIDRLNTLARENCEFKEVNCGDDVLAMVDKLIAASGQPARIGTLCGFGEVDGKWELKSSKWDAGRLLLHLEKP